MLTLFQIAKQSGCTFFALSEAIIATGLNGVMVGDARLWTEEDAEELIRVARASRSAPNDDSH
jgi:hypothetical protein